MAPKHDEYAGTVLLTGASGAVRREPAGALAADGADLVLVARGVERLGEVVSGRYEIVEPLGIGAFARVYRARDRSTNREVALKISNRITEDASSRALEEELRTCARISHPHVAGVMDAGTTACGESFLVFEYIAGTTLRSVIDERGALEPALALRWMCEVLDALAAVHRQGVVHRDVKPENIMITCSGVVEHAILLDLGLGALARTGDGATLPLLELAGTPRYAAPEQLRSEIATPRADLYSWGLVLAECLTGTSAVRAESAREAVDEQLSAEPVRLPAALEKTPLGRVLAEVTHKNADRRPESAAIMLAMLADAVRPIEILASGVAQARSGSRQVTVLSARLAHAIGGEANALLQEECDAVAELCRVGGGTVVSAVGDRITAVFGLRHPDSHDAERALEVAAKLALRPGTAWTGSETAAWHVGVHTGEIEFRASSHDFEGPDALLGTTCAVAAALDELAPPGRVVVSADTRTAAHDHWVTASMNPVRSTRLAEPLSAFRIRRRRTREPQGSETMPITGRVREREILEIAWKAATSKGTLPLFVSGQAGIGKSRLVEETRRIAPEADWLEFRCTIERQAVPFSGLVSLVESLNADPVTLAHRYRLRTTEAVPILATLLGEPMPEGYAMPPVTPERYRELVAQTVMQLLVDAASDGPTVIVAEDLHWADPSSLDFLMLLIAEIGRRIEMGTPLPLLLLLTSRSEFAASWPPDGLVRIELQPMPASDVEQMILGGLRASGGVDRKVVAELVDASAGLPLFAEQVTRLVANRLTVESEDREIPRSIENVLSAQIELLGDDTRKVAQVAATIGHYFDSELVGAAASMERPALRSALQELTDTGIATRSAGDSRTGYAFTHILLRDAAYKSVPETERRRMHRRIADVIERDHPQIGLQRPAELALQRELACDSEAAAALWHRAGMQALANAGYPEACDDLGRGIRLLEQLPDTREKTLRLLGLTTALGSAHVMTRGFGAPETRSAFQSASKLCSETGHDVPLEVLGGLFGAALNSADRDELDPLLPRFRALSQRTDSALFAFAGQQVLLVEAYWNGRMNEAWDRAKICIELYRRESLQSVLWEFAFGIPCYAYGMLAQFHRGHADEGEALRLEMMERAERNGGPLLLATALGWSTILLMASGRAEETIDESNRLLRLATEQHLTLWATYATISRGAMLAEAGDAAAQVPVVRQAMDMLEAVGSVCSRIGYSPYWARTLLAAGDIEGALDEVRHGMESCEKYWTRIQEPELVRLHGVLLERIGRAEDAQGEFRRALAIARKDGNMAAQGWILASAPGLAASAG
jgi:class 3 adenylate cyclase/tetratricopeptide (TPR) repeat protein